MKRVHVLQSSDGYEALYLDGKLYDEGSPLGEGDSALYFLKLHEKHPEITSKDIAFVSLSEADESDLRFDGVWPDDIIEFNNSYEQP